MTHSTFTRQTADFIAPEEPSPLESITNLNDCVAALDHAIADIREFDELHLALRRTENIATFLKREIRDQISRFDTFIDTFNKKRARHKPASPLAR